MRYLEKAIRCTYPQLVPWLKKCHSWSVPCSSPCLTWLQHSHVFLVWSTSYRNTGQSLPLTGVSTRSLKGWVGLEGSAGKAGEMKWAGSKFTADTGTCGWRLSGGGAELTVFSWGEFSSSIFWCWNPGLFSLDLSGKQKVLPAANSTSNLIQQGALSSGRRDSDCRG